MCASCVAQGVVYVGGALTGLQVMAARARSRRASGRPGAEVDEVEPAGPMPGPVDTSDGAPRLEPATGAR